MDYRCLGRSGLKVAPVGFGAFKIGRNQKTKYPHQYDLPDAQHVACLLNGVLDAGINLIDTAPAYGLSESLIGRYLAHRRSEFVLSTKVGERFIGGQSVHDFSAAALRQSIENSLAALHTDYVDILLLHSDGQDSEIMQHTDAVTVLQYAKARGQARCIGLSGKTVEGARDALAWADVLMLPYHLQDTAHAPILDEALAQGVGILIKKVLASGHLSAAAAISFATRHPAVGAAVVGSLSIEHMRLNLSYASQELA